MEPPQQHRIPRKPVPLSPLSPPPPYVESPATAATYVESPTTLSAATEYSSYDASIYDDFDHDFPEASTRERLQFLTVDDQRPPSRSPVATPPLRSTRSSPNLQGQSTQHEAQRPDLPRQTSTTQKAGQAAISAYQEARHFAGGLVSHPFEYTKQYSILRHSHGLVFYSGSYTNIAFTVFADRPLPPDRSFWLQRRGWSGKTGLRAGVLFGTHGAWIDVTPETVVTAEQIKPTDERAWQRDIEKFLRKAPRKLAQHVPRETAVLRVPCQADDGYLRVVMCCGENGKKHLCPSPIFRLASTSMESSSLRGASLKTLPLEAAVKIGTAVGTKFVQTAAAPYVASAKALAVTQATSVFQPSAVEMAVAQRAYDESGVAESLVKMEETWESRQMNALNQAMGYREAFEPASMVIGLDDGPAPPFPIRFNGKVAPDPVSTTTSAELPALTVTNVDSNILLKHTGIFIGWTSITLSKKSLQATSPTSPTSPTLPTLPPSPTTSNIPLPSTTTHQSIISIIPSPTARANVIATKHITISLLTDNLPPAPRLPNAKLTIMLMAFLRPSSSSQPAQLATAQLDADILITTNSLSRPAWQPEPTLTRIKTASSQRSVTERYVDARRGVQENVVDKVPVHRLGVRMGAHVRRDGFHGRGGVFVLR